MIKIVVITVSNKKFDILAITSFEVKFQPITPPTAEIGPEVKNTL